VILEPEAIVSEDASKQPALFIFGFAPVSSKVEIIRLIATSIVDSELASASASIFEPFLS
jgi:hypothetical protein